MKNRASRKARVISSRVVYRGSIFDVRRDKVREPGGIVATRDIVVHFGSIVLIPVLDDGRILLVRQYRHATGESLWELVAGRTERGENPARAARRELEEETGYTGRRFRRLIEFFPTPGFVSERMVMYLVEGLKAGTARRALEAGAWIINDVSGLRLDPAIAEVRAAQDAGLILMHSRGTVRTMATYEHAHYRDVVAEVEAELAGALARARERGVPGGRVVLDPGLGFSKTPEQSVAVLRAVPALAGLGYPVMLGPSRKRFLGAVTGRALAERDVATAAACALGWMLGARLFRVHAPGPVRDALAVAAAVGGA